MACTGAGGRAGILISRAITVLQAALARAVACTADSLLAAREEEKS